MTAEAEATLCVTGFPPHAVWGMHQPACHVALASCCLEYANRYAWSMHARMMHDAIDGRPSCPDAQAAQHM